MNYYYLSKKWCHFKKSDKWYPSERFRSSIKYLWGIFFAVVIKEMELCTSYLDWLFLSFSESGKKVYLMHIITEARSSNKLLQTNKKEEENFIFVKHNNSTEERSFFSSNISDLTLHFVLFFIVSKTKRERIGQYNTAWFLIQSNISWLCKNAKV